MKKFLYMHLETEAMEYGAQIGDLWSKKISFLPADEQPSAWDDLAGKYAGFSKITAIHLGYFNGAGVAAEKSIGEDPIMAEREIIKRAMKLIQDSRKVGYKYLAGYDIIDKQIPFLLKRMMVHGIAIPQWLDLRKLKPWEVAMDDIMRMWQCGSKKDYPSLDELWHTFEIEYRGIHGIMELHRRMTTVIPDAKKNTRDIPEDWKGPGEDNGAFKLPNGKDVSTVTEVPEVIRVVHSPRSENIEQLLLNSLKP